jgi:hypothetical protein
LKPTPSSNAAPVQPATEHIEPSADPEVPEADAIEQSQVVPDDEYDHPR